MNEIARVPSPTRRQWRLRVAAVSGAGLLVTALLFFAMGGVVPGPRALWLVALAAMPGLSTTAAMAWVSRPTRSMLGRPRALLVTGCLVALLVLVIGALAIAHVDPHPLAVPRVTTHAACAVITLLQGTVPLVSLVVLRARGAPVHPVLTGAVLGMTSGAVAETMAYLRCPYSSASHGLVAHVLPVVAFALLGALLGRVLLRPR